MNESSYAAPVDPHYDCSAFPWLSPPDNYFGPTLGSCPWEGTRLSMVLTRRTSRFTLNSPTSTVPYTNERMCEINPSADPLCSPLTSFFQSRLFDFALNKSDPTSGDQNSVAIAAFSNYIKSFNATTAASPSGYLSLLNLSNWIDSKRFIGFKSFIPLTSGWIAATGV